MNLNVILLIVGMIFALLVVIGASKLIFRCAKKLLTIITAPIVLTFKMFKILANKIKH